MRRAALLLVTALAAACGSSGDDHFAPRDPRDAAPATLRIFATGEMRGFMSPCGCEEKQLGGLSRRASYLTDAARPADLRIDLGNAAAGAGDLRDLRMEATLEGLDRLDYDAFVPGELEVLAADVLLAASRRHPAVPVVSANLRAADGAAVFPAYVEHETRDGRTIAVIGLSPAVTALPPGWSVTAPRSALENTLAEIGDAADAVVVAAALPDDAAHELVRGLERVSLLLAPRIPDPEATMTAATTMTDADEGLRLLGAEGAPPLAVVGEFAGFVRRVDLDETLLPGAAWRAWLGEEWADDPEMAVFVDDVHDRAIALDPTLIPDILRGLVARDTAGSAICAECHEEDHASWLASGHAHAMQTLVERDSARDPSCVPCHLVDLPGEFADEPPSEFEPADGDALGVGCEACHGGRREHVENAMNGVVPPGGAPPWSPHETCRGCHHPPEVKRFDPEAAWEAIRHGDR